MKLLTVREVAETLNLSLPTVRHLIDGGNLEAIFIPGAVGARRIRRVSPQALQRFLDTNNNSEEKRA